MDQEQPPKKKKKVKGHNEELDSLLISNLIQMKEKDLSDDEEELFGRQVAATLRRLTKHQKAIAKMRIHTVLLQVEFPEETLTPQPHLYGYQYWMDIYS